MEKTSCLFCQTADERILFVNKDRNWQIPGEFCLIQCRQCGLVYINPRPDREEIKNYYPKIYFKRQVSQKYIGRSFKGRLALIKKFKGTGRLLEVGCADGIFLKFMKTEGYDVRGLDASSDAVGLAKSNIGGSYIDLGDLQSTCYSDESFDVVCFFEVLEHLHNPLEALKETRRILKKDGIVVLSVPNFNSLERLLFGRFWHGLDMPRHLFHLTKNSLTRLFEAAQFQIKSIGPVHSHKVNDVGVTEGYSESIRLFLRQRGLYPDKFYPMDETMQKSIKKLNLFKKFFHIFEKIFFYFFVIAAQVLGRQATLVAIAGK